jgi:hypothetical protein
MKKTFMAIAPICAILFSGCGTNGVSNSPAAPTDAMAQSIAAVDPADGAAAAYCHQTGGEVEVRRAVYGSNGPSLLFLSGVKSFCQYTRKKDGSRIHILLSTLYTTKPTLAALAYILEPPTGSCNGNPGSIDSWGVAYHANSIIRGIDLEKVMRHKYHGSLQ